MRDRDNQFLTSMGDANHYFKKPSRIHSTIFDTKPRKFEELYYLNLCWVLIALEEKSFLKIQIQFCLLMYIIIQLNTIKSWLTKRLALIKMQQRLLLN